MAELQEGGNPKEFMDNNGKKLEEIKQQKDSQGSGRPTKYEVSSIPAVFGVLLFLFVCYTVIEPETKRTQGIVKDRKANSIVVQNFKDTTLYNVFKHDDKMTVDKKRAFSHVAPGDTLEYVLSKSSNTVTFSAARKVNGMSMAEFAKQRQRIMESAKIRNGLNQKTK
jgi:hypothetical protein